MELFEEFCLLNKIVNDSIKKSLFLTHIGTKNYDILHNAYLPVKPNTKSLEELFKIIKNKYNCVKMQFWRSHKRSLQRSTDMWNTFRTHSQKAFEYPEPYLPIS